MKINQAESKLERKVNVNGKMAFFRKWKNHYGHKKFTSDDPNEAEDWGLGKPLANNNKDFQANIENMKMQIESIEADGEHDGIMSGAGDESGSGILFATYDIKYLGCTPIETKRTEKVTSEAIKTVIANSKAGGRKNKSQKRVKLNVSQDGIEVMDHGTQETLMRFSIYKISYCSVDAAHDHAFSFVGAETDPLTEKEKLSCHVFICPKRKIAHEITLMVARCFEHAYQHWRDMVVVQQKQQQKQQQKNCDNQNELQRNGVIESRAEVHHHQQQQQHSHADNTKSNGNLLIDLAAADTDVRKFLQNTWVSFEDDNNHAVVAF